MTKFQVKDLVNFITKEEEEEDTIILLLMERDLQWTEMN
jgi:hypothetical protein